MRNETLSYSYTIDHSQIHPPLPFFLERGFYVDSLDGSEAMKREAERLFGINVRLSDFLSLDEEEKYDGVWAQASILHLEEESLRKVLYLI